MSTSRRRVLDERQTTYWLTDMYRPGPSPWTGTQYYSDPIGSDGTLSTMDDNRNRGFRQRRARGEIVMSDMALYRWTRSHSPGSLTIGPFSVSNYVVPKGGYNTMHGDLTVQVEGATRIGSSPISGYLDQIEQIALVKAYAKINQATILGGEILSDLGQTVGMLRRPFRGATELLSRMLKYKAKHVGKTARSAAQASANAWLEYRYGWTPLILDSESIMKESQRKRDSFLKRRLVVRAGETARGKISRSFADQPITGSFFKVSGSTEVQQEIRASAGVIFDLYDQTVSQDWMRVFGLRAQDIPSTTWEIIPYSFVVDWFANVGDWISAISPKPNINILGSWVTTVNTRTDTWSGGVIKYVDQLITPVPTGSWGGSSIVDTTVTRRCSPILASHPVLTVRPPSILHSVDGLALSLKPILGQLSKLRH